MCLICTKLCMHHSGEWWVVTSLTGYAGYAPRDITRVVKQSSLKAHQLRTMFLNRWIVGPFWVGCRVCSQRNNNSLRLSAIRMSTMLRPFFLPREFGNTVVCCLRAPKWKRRKSCSPSGGLHRQLQHTPDSPMLILGDINHCKLEMSLPGFEQYIKCGTRNTKNSW